MAMKAKFSKKSGEDKCLLAQILRGLGKSTMVTDHDQMLCLLIASLRKEEIGDFAKGLVKHDKINEKNFGKGPSVTIVFGFCAREIAEQVSPPQSEMFNLFIKELRKLKAEAYIEILEKSLQVFMEEK